MEQRSQDKKADPLKAPDLLNVTSRNSLYLDFSNLAETPFKIDQQKFASIEAFLQYIKYPNLLCSSEQIKRFADSPFISLKPDDLLDFVESIPDLSGVKAKRAGARANELISFNHKRGMPNFIYWKGQEIPYRSEAHFNLIEKAIRLKFLQNPGLTALLCSTGQIPITHDVGTVESKLTSLRNTEFVAILEKIRAENKNIYWHPPHF